MRESFKGRLNLSERASEALLFMVQQLKEENPHLQINVSRLCSWIVENYVRDHFSKETLKIAEAHFNPKRYVTEMLKTAKTEDEMKALFQNAMSQLNGKSAPLVAKPRKPKTHREAEPSNGGTAETSDLTSGVHHGTKR